jgi:hypothetical protein
VYAQVSLVPESEVGGFLILLYLQLLKNVRKFGRLSFWMIIL